MKTSYWLPIALLFFCSCDKETHPINAAKHLVQVSTLKIQPKTIPAEYEFVGVAQSSHEVDIRAHVMGYLDHVNYTEGEFVQKGQLLFQLDQRSFVAALDSAKAELSKQEAVLWDAKRSVDRYEPLFQQKAASRRDLDNAIAHQLTSEASVVAAQAHVRDAEINVDYTLITSPVSGLSGKSNFREGALINAGQTTLTTISVIHPIWVNFSVSDREILKFREEMTKGNVQSPPGDNFSVQVTLSNQTLFPETGKVNFTAPTYDQKTGTMTIRAVLPNPDNLLRPGQFVRVKLLGAVRPHAIVVPQQSVMQSQNGMFVYVIGPKNQVEIRLIEPGTWYQKSWVINSGLQEGDRVIVEGVNKVQPGMIVNPVELKQE